MEETCKECGKSIKNEPGRKPKKFCSQVCRNRYFNKENAALLKELKNKLKTAKPETDKVKKDLMETGTSVYETKSNGEIKRIDPMSEKADILLRISELEKELKNPPKNPIIGLKRWVAAREIEIKELKQKLVPIESI